MGMGTTKRSIDYVCTYMYVLVNFSNEWRKNVMVILSPVHSANYGAIHTKSQKVGPYWIGSQICDGWTILASS